MTLIQTYAPTNDAREEEKEEFYEQLQTTVDKCNKHDIVIIMGDLNAKVGDNNKDTEEIMGKHGMGSMNKNGERLCDFCLVNGFIITGTCFPNPEAHKATWVSPDGNTRNQIDHMMIRRELRRSVQDTRVYRGADAASDHYLVIMKLKLKLHRNPNRTKAKPRFDNQKLVNPIFKAKYSVELRNRFHALEVEENLNEDCKQRGTDNILRKEQAGFRKGRSTLEQIFILRNIMEQVNEWQATLYTHFVDFEKAFDSLHRRGLWNIMKSYGIPEKLIRMVKLMYDDFECAVIDEGEQTRWFKITTGVKQGCVMSGFLFLLAIDWIMRQTTERHRNGIRWDLTSTLEDLDFADDIALILFKVRTHTSQN
nr:hypothetical protein BaRGS_003250 [Batillaria attramentaria]